MAERVSVGPFDVNNLCAELAELCTNERLRNENAGADYTNAFERSEFGNQRWRCGPLQAPDPFRYLLAKLVDLLVMFHQSRVMAHLWPPSRCVIVEALLCLPDGTLTEGTHTSFFGVLEGTLLTAPTSSAILPGITRSLILRLAEQAGIPVREHVLNRSDLSTVSELFLTGTTSEVLPIVRVDGKPVGSGKPGLVTRRLQGAYVHALDVFMVEPGLR